MAQALQIVQKFFPNVKHVLDADKPITVEVTKQDNLSAARRNHKACAMAVACKKKTQADGVIISVKTAYVIKGNQAIRYKMPESASREIVSFDRNAGFGVGEYTLRAPGKTERLGAISNGSYRGERNGSFVKKRKHFTSGIRTVLTSVK